VKLNLIPLWFVVVMVGRDLLILLGGIYIKKAKGVVLQSNQLGKWTIGVIALAMFFAICHSERSEESLPWLRISSSVVDAFLWLSVAMLAVSFSLYVARFVQIHRLSKGLQTERQENSA
jgi:phosphatidylglycerophosphate synthase